MKTLIFPAIIATLLLTLFLTSYLAKYMQAKYWKMPPVSAAWGVSGVLSFLLLIAIDFWPVDMLDSITLTAIKVILPILLTTFVFMAIIRLDFLGALTVNLVGLLVAIILSLVVAIVLGGHSIDKASKITNVYLQTAKAQVISMITGKPIDKKAIEALDPVKEVEYEPLEPIYTEKDFLPPGAQKALAIQEQQKYAYTNPVYRTINVSDARSMIGKRVRVSWKDGNISAGKLEAIRSGDLIVTLRQKEGVAQIPIPISRVKKFEVYQ